MTANRLPPVPGGTELVDGASIATAWPDLDLATNIIIKTSDDQHYRFRRDAVWMSDFIKDNLADLESEPDTKGFPVIHLMKVHSSRLDHWNNPAKTIPKVPFDKIEDVVDDWDRSFLLERVYPDFDDSLLVVDLFAAADLLKMESLLQLLGAGIALGVRGQSTEQIRARFRIKNDLTPEEEERIAEENKYAIIE
jgi:hypothetical protein